MPVEGTLVERASAEAAVAEDAFVEETCTEGILRLLERCAAGCDGGAWDELMVRFGRRLSSGVGRALRRAGLRPRRQDREDYLQEVYCRLLEDRGRRLRRCRGSGERAVGAYLSRIAESVTLDHLRSQAADKRGGGRVVSLERPGRFGKTRSVRDLAASPEERLLAREKRTVFIRRCRRAAGPKTTRRDLRILYLAFFVGLSSRQVARIVGGGMSPNSVDSVIYRVRRRLEKGGVPLPRRRSDRL